MYLPIPSQPDCASAWRAAVAAVDDPKKGRVAHNVVIDIADPVAGTNVDDPRVAVVDGFLSPFEKSVETVANTIFPASLYYRHGAPAFFDVFAGRVLPKVRKNSRWSGYYFERMMQLPAVGGGTINQLWDMVERMRKPSVHANNKFELCLFDPCRDIDNSPFGGQCLSFLSFKLLPGNHKTLVLTALYRNHYYIEKLLGNMIGLGRLMEFVAREAGVKLGPLTIVSTHAEIDQPKSKTRTTLRADIDALLIEFDQASAGARAPA